MCRLAYLDQSKWQLHSYGRYVGPISIFASMSRLFSHAQPIDFGIGYKWRTPNLLAAVNTTVSAEVATEPAAVAVAAPQAQGSTSENAPNILADEPASERRRAEGSHKAQVTNKVRTARVQHAAPWSFWWPVRR